MNSSLDRPIPCGHPALSYRSAPTGRRPNALLHAVVAAASTVLVTLPLSAARLPYADGEIVTITGSVTDPQGAPIEGVQVVLEASRRGLTLRPPGRAKKELERHFATTDRAGAFQVEWAWNRRYNTFELLVGVTFRRLEGERLKIVERLDITGRLAQGSPCIVALAVRDMTFLRSMRDFLGALQGADQERIYRQLGKPDRVERVEHPSSVEVAWWYFRQGKVVRFRDGALLETEIFDAVEPFAEDGG